MKKWSCFPDEKPVFSLRFLYYLAANFDLSDVKPGLRTADLNYGMLKAINDHNSCQLELKYLMTIVAEVKNVLPKEPLKTLEKALFIQPAAAFSQTGTLSNDPLFHKSLDACLNLNSNTLAAVLQAERLTLISTYEASQKRDGGQKPKKKDKKKDPSAFTWQALLIELVT